MSTKRDDNYVLLDVSGTVFRLHKKLLKQFPNALLSRLADVLNKNLSIKQMHSILPVEFSTTDEKNKFFVQRSPSLFELVLQCYITGKLHIPYWMCKTNVMQEMAFWKLNVNNDCCECCQQNNCDAEDGLTMLKEKLLEIELQKRSKWQKLKHSMWIFFEHPNSSKAALAYAVATMAFVFTTIINMVFSSVPAFAHCPDNNTKILTASEVDESVSLILNILEGGNETEQFENHTTTVMQPEGVLRFFSNCWGLRLSETVEMICVAWFTIEFVLRFTTCPDRWYFMKGALNVIDFVATFRYYVELALWGMGFENGSTLIMIIRMIRTVSVFRILKLARYHEDLGILGETLLSAKKEISMLLVFMLVTLLMYSCLVFQLEKDVPNTHFSSIPASLWWAIVTLTTVGYGDVCPVTTPGKIIGGCACVTGILIVGLPMSILVDTFTSKYKKKSSPLFNSIVEPFRHVKATKF